MKLRFGPTLKQRREDRAFRKRNATRESFLKYKEWHDFFTLVPRRVGSDEHRWLETIQRRIGPRYDFDDYDEGNFRVEYRAKPKAVETRIEEPSLT